MLMKLQGVVRNDQFLVHYVFHAYFCNSVLMIREKVVPYRGDIATRSDMKCNITYLCITFFSTWYRPKSKIKDFCWGKVTHLMDLLLAWLPAILLISYFYITVTSHQCHVVLYHRTLDYASQSLLWEYFVYIDGLVQDCSNFSALAMVLLQSCTKPSINAKYHSQCRTESYEYMYL